MPQTPRISAYSASVRSLFSPHREISAIIFISPSIENIHQEDVSRFPHASTYSLSIMPVQHQCPHCSREFSRAEHLVRHKRIRTLIIQGGTSEVLHMLTVVKILEKNHSTTNSAIRSSRDVTCYAGMSQKLIKFKLRLIAIGKVMNRLSLETRLFTKSVGT